MVSLPLQECIPCLTIIWFLLRSSIPIAWGQLECSTFYRKYGEWSENPWKVDYHKVIQKLKGNGEYDGQHHIDKFWTWFPNPNKLKTDYKHSNLSCMLKSAKTREGTSAEKEMDQGCSTDHKQKSSKFLKSQSRVAERERWKFSSEILFCELLCWKEKEYCLFAWHFILVECCTQICWQTPNLDIKYSN